MIVLKLFTVSSSSHPVSADSSNQDNNCHIDRNRDPDCDNVEDNSDPLFSLGRIIITGPLVISCLQNKTFINFNYSNCKYCKGTNFCGVNFAEHTPVAKFNHRLSLLCQQTAGKSASTVTIILNDQIKVSYRFK